MVIIYKIGQCLLSTAFFLLVTITTSYAATEKLNDVQMVDCTNDFCVYLNSSHVSRSLLSSNFAFGPSDIVIRSARKGISRKEFKGFEGAFEPKSKRYFISNAKTKKEFVIDMKTRSVTDYSIH